MRGFHVSRRRVELAFRDDKGFIRVQPDRHGGEGAGGHAYEALLPYGLYSRPASPDKPLPDETQGTAAAALVFLESFGEGFAMPLGDARFASVVPDSGDGGVVLAMGFVDGVEKKSSSLRLAGGDLDGVEKGTVELRAPTAGGDLSFKLTRDSTGAIRLDHPAGGSIVITSTKITITAPVTVELGGEGGQPPVLLTALSTYLTALNAAISAGIASAGGAYTAPPTPSLGATKVTVT